MHIFRTLPYSSHLAQIVKDLGVTDVDLATPYGNYIPHPIESTECCRTCHETFDTVPIFIPTAKTERGFVVCSCHCSIECARHKQLSDPRLAGMDAKLLEEYCSILGLPSFPLSGAPALDGLVIGYGGPLTKQEWRERFTTRLVWDAEGNSFLVKHPTEPSPGDPFQDGGRTFMQKRGRPLLQKALSLSPFITHVGEKTVLWSRDDDDDDDHK